jgi:prevent-host-death family protein
MESVNIHEAKTHLSHLLERVQAGESVIICKAGKPIARLVPLESAVAPITPPKRRQLGTMRGHGVVPDDFNTFGQEEIIKMFEGSE